MIQLFPRPLPEEVLITLLLEPSIEHSCVRSPRIAEFSDDEIKQVLTAFKIHEEVHIKLE